MNKITRLIIALSCFMMSVPIHAQDGSYDVFVPISKYLAQGDTEKLSAWFADNLEVSILEKTCNSSKSQARQIMKSFFDNNTPRSFDITHTTGKGNMKYAIGTLNAGGERYLVTIFVNFNGSSYKIQQIKLDKIQ